LSSREPGGVTFALNNLKTPNALLSEGIYILVTRGIAKLKYRRRTYLSVWLYGLAVLWTWHLLSLAETGRGAFEKV
jgi:hypothetical protein